jgi:putative phosphoesterase
LDGLALDVRLAQNEPQVRLGLIADIHGNLPALERVLAELEREQVDQIVCLGDVAVGPQPVQTLERVQALGCPTVMGNWDACLLGAEPHVDGEMAEMLVDVCTWSAAQISPAQQEFVRGFKNTLEFRLEDDLKLLAFHGSPRSVDDEIFAATPDSELESMLAGHEADVYAGGHTHFQMLRRLGELLVVNVGSVGQSFRRLNAGIRPLLPWAEYCIVAALDGNLSVELRRTPVDVESLAHAVRNSGMPDAERWAALWTPN